MQDILTNSTLIWSAIGIIFIIVEIMTISFFAFFLAVGAFISAVVAIWCDSLLIQILVFAVVSALSMIFGKPFLKKFFKISEEVRPSAGNAMIGQKGVVLKQISSLENGQVRINGEVWTATTDSEVSIEEGTLVIVESLIGVKVNVKALSSDDAE